MKIGDDGRVTGEIKACSRIVIPAATSPCSLTRESACTANGLNVGAYLSPTLTEQSNRQEYHLPLRIPAARLHRG